MKNIINKFLDILGFKIETDITYNNFIIGKTSYIIFDFTNNKNIINNSLVNKIIINVSSFYWFRSYYEFEANMDTLISDNLKEVFIFIG